MRTRSNPNGRGGNKLPRPFFIGGNLSVQAKATIFGKFSASHVVNNHSRCGRLHGHEWFVWATTVGNIDPKTGMVVDFGEIKETLDKIISEFDNKHINDMLPGVPATHEGIAAYVRERIALSFPKISVVSVATSDYKAEIEWSIR